MRRAQNISRDSAMTYEEESVALAVGPVVLIADPKHKSGLVSNRQVPLWKPSLRKLVIWSYDKLIVKRLLNTFSSN